MAAARTPRHHHDLNRHDTWDCMLPGPPSRNNGGCADYSPAGLLAYGAGSSVVVADPRSMQLVSVLPMPAPSQSGGGGGGLASSTGSAGSSSALAPFVTAVRWCPHPLPRDILAPDDDPSANPHLRIAAGDRQGRIAIWDFRARQILTWLELDKGSRLGVQDLCWIRTSSWILASISGPSLLCLWDVSNGRCFWKYDSSPEYLSCIRRDPFDSRHVCVLGLKGFLLSAKVIGLGENDVIIRELHVSASYDLSADIQKAERDSSSVSPGSPALASFPLFFSRISFSPLWRHIIYVTFPKELVVYDLHYGAALSSAMLPRGYGKFMEALPDPNNDILYCSHLDGKLSCWKRKKGEQVNELCIAEELIPSIGTPVPSPSALAVILCQSESAIQDIAALSSDLTCISTSSYSNCTTSLKFQGNEFTATKTNIISISDDGKIWSWLMSVEGAGLNQSVTSNSNENFVGGDVSRKTHIEPTDASNAAEFKSSFKIDLVGQLHLLSSTVTTLAVPSPSLTATLARGGNNPAAAVPLVALGTQNGTIDIIDVSANAVAASFSVHNSTIRGLRWLGNSRIVSFSYSQMNDKSGGYTNKLIVTCIRSGLNRAFRVLQKPERASIRALRASSSGRYLLILFRDAPVEVWAMTKNPIMLRSLALPFTVLEWTLPTAPRPSQNGSSRQPSSSIKEQTSVTVPTANLSPVDSNVSATEASADDTTESFAFALINGALGVFEVHGRRIRDFRPKWPSSSFVSSDGLVTAMAYRLPHVVMGDRSGYIRWWDVTTGLSSSFNTHREGIRRIKFSPVVPGDRSRGRIAVLFYDNTFSVFDLDTQDPLANALLQQQSTGTLVLELDWLPTRTSKNEPLVLCIAGVDSSFRLIEVNINDAKSETKSRVLKERFRPVPLCLPILFPTAHALALRMILQFGVKERWFKSFDVTRDKLLEQIPETDQVSSGDLRHYMVDSMLPVVGDPVVPELLLKILEPYKKEGYILDRERIEIYTSIAHKGSIARLAFAAAIFGEFSEAFFWLQLPHALRHSMDKSMSASIFYRRAEARSTDSASMSKLSRIMSTENFNSKGNIDYVNNGQLSSMAFKQEELWGTANERISWHEKLDGDDAIQKRVHELVSVGNLEDAVTLLLSTPPEGANFYPNALRAVALSSAVSRSLHELAVKVVAANMVRTDKSLSGTHLLCAVGRYQEACSQLQDAGCWTDAATLAASHLGGSDYSRVLQRWADHVYHNEHNLWRALILYVAAGAMREAIAALRDSKQPDAAAMFLLACHEINIEVSSNPEKLDEPVESVKTEKESLILPHMIEGHEDIIAISEYFGQYQRKLVHLCMDSTPYFD